MADSRFFANAGPFSLAHIAETAGAVREVFVEDGQPVEYGEPLLAIG